MSSVKAKPAHGLVPRNPFLTEALTDHFPEFRGFVRIVRPTFISLFVGELEDLMLPEDDVFGYSLPIDEGNRFGRDLEFQKVYQSEPPRA